MFNFVGNSQQMKQTVLWKAVISIQEALAPLMRKDRSVPLALKPGWHQLPDKLNDMGVRQGFKLINEMGDSLKVNFLI